MRTGPLTVPVLALVDRASDPAAIVGKTQVTSDVASKKVRKTTVDGSEDLGAGTGGVGLPTPVLPHAFLVSKLDKSGYKEVTIDVDTLKLDNVYDTTTLSPAADATLHGSLDVALRDMWGISSINTPSSFALPVTEATTVTGNILYWKAASASGPVTLTLDFIIRAGTYYVLVGDTAAEAPPHDIALTLTTTGVVAGSYVGAVSATPLTGFSKVYSFTVPVDDTATDITLTAGQVGTYYLSFLKYNATAKSVTGGSNVPFDSVLSALASAGSGGGSTLEITRETTSGQAGVISMSAFSSGTEQTVRINVNDATDTILNLGVPNHSMRLTFVTYGTGSATVTVKPANSDPFYIDGTDENATGYTLLLGEAITFEYDHLNTEWIAL